MYNEVLGSNSSIHFKACSLYDEVTQGTATILSVMLQY